VRFERKHALFLLAVAAWNTLTYARFTKALVQTEEERPTSYFVAHGVLIAVNVGIAGVLGTWGWKALRAVGRAR
jgi:hypothetical protein